LRACWAIHVNSISLAEMSSGATCLWRDSRAFGRKRDPGRQ
jgi:hypothetical protein